MHLQQNSNFMHPTKAINVLYVYVIQKCNNTGENSVTMVQKLIYFSNST